MLKIGHRGAAGHALENTIKSFEKALELGVDAIEFDVRAIENGEIVVFHDPTLKRIVGWDAKVSSLSKADLQRVNSRIGCEPIPTLDEIFERFGRRTILNIELKEEGIAERVLKQIHSRNFEDCVIVSAFDDSDNEPGDSSNWVDLLWMKRKEPKLKIALLAEKEENLHRAIAISMAYHVHAVAISEGLAMGRDNIFLLRGVPARPKIFVWTVNDVERMKQLNQLWVDGIFSDYPDRFKEAGIR